MWGTPKSAVRTYGTYKVPACARSYGRGMRRESSRCFTACQLELTVMQWRVSLNETEWQSSHESHVGHQLRSPNFMLCGYM